ncbi:MAG: SMP-30/gluconolactonase/LRE family protein [Flavobacteriales bacterium]|nr:SMP-30/gluconolactonase/LRE family protein [Flavobacteriales bacterium]
MKKTTIIALAIFLILFAVVAYDMVSIGLLRTVENHFAGETVKEIGLAGAEDITVSVTDSFAIISSTARGVYPPKETEKGGLYLMELKSGNFIVKHLTHDFQGPFAPHGISMFKHDSTYTIAAINHTEHGHSIEFFTLVGEELTHTRTERSTALVSPNDLVLIDAQRFYVTNDHGYTEGIGKLLEEYGNLGVSNVMYFDGQQYTEVAKGIAYANGINLDNGRNLLFVASPRRFRVKVYQRAEDGQLTFVEDIHCGTGVDNIEFDTEGNLWCGGHPKLLRFAAYGMGRKETAPSEVVKVTYRAKGDYSVESIYTDDGVQLSATSVAAPFGNLLLVGTVKDRKMLVLRRD